MMPFRSWSGVREIPWSTPATTRRGRSNGARCPRSDSGRPGTLVGSGGAGDWANPDRSTATAPAAPSTPASRARREIVVRLTDVSPLASEAIAEPERQDGIHLQILADVVLRLEDRKSTRLNSSHP